MYILMCALLLGMFYYFFKLILLSSSKCLLKYYRFPRYVGRFSLIIGKFMPCSVIHLLKWELNLGGGNVILRLLFEDIYIV